jgi:hypothetical protein
MTTLGHMIASGLSDERIVGDAAREILASMQ